MNSQAPLSDQLWQLAILADRAGLYDASDYCKRAVSSMRGPHCPDCGVSEGRQHHLGCDDYGFVYREGR